MKAILNTKNWNECKIHGILELKDIYKNGRCARCARLYAKEQRDSKRNEELQRQKAYREKLKNIEINEKICVNHGKITKENIDRYHRCILCLRERNKRAYDNNYHRWSRKDPAKRREAYKNNKERMRSYSKKYEQKNSEKIKALRKKNNQKYRQELTDGVVKNSLVRRFKFKTTEIPHDLIDIERARIKIARLLKEKYGTTRCPK